MVEMEEMEEMVVVETFRKLFDGSSDESYDQLYSPPSWWGVLQRWLTRNTRHDFLNILHVS